MCRDMNHQEGILSQIRRLTSRAVIAAIILTVSVPGPAAAADPGEVEKLRSEAQQLRAELQALRAAVAEASELELQRASNLSKQMKDLKNAPQPESAPAVATSETGSGSREVNGVLPPTAGEERTPRAKHRRHRHTSRSRSKASRSKTRD
jgi:hypothetical protein